MIEGTRSRHERDERERDEIEICQRDPGVVSSSGQVLPLLLSIGLGRERDDFNGWGLAPAAYERDGTT